MTPRKSSLNMQKRMVVMFMLRHCLRDRKRNYYSRDSSASIVNANGKSLSSRRRLHDALGLAYNLDSSPGMAFVSDFPIHAIPLCRR